METMMLVWSNMDLISLPIAFCGFCSITYISDASSFPRVRMDPLFEKIKWKQKGFFHPLFCAVLMRN
ncbi:unnamed protein product [Musa acuminata subsp. malaccensis]|uniref:(wild Malaysian banana) hypothetical protein n=1 Tax=Musa acuminata subsp. malaccensis TaxID=214687 RepID=A0A804KJJ6_MUSAM|nr:unnamed protein product [Musa acuminata subsp. malaccensis]